MISEKIQLLGKHPANTQDETSSRKHQRISYTSDTPPVVWKPPTSYSQPSQVTPTSSGPLLSLVPAQQTISQFATKFPRYSSSSSYITPQGMSPISPPGSVTTPPDLSPPVTTHTLGMKVSYFHLRSAYSSVFHLKCILLCVDWYMQHCHYKYI